MPSTSLFLNMTAKTESLSILRPAVSAVTPAVPVRQRHRHSNTDHESTNIRQYQKGNPTQLSAWISFLSVSENAIYQ